MNHSNPSEGKREKNPIPAPLIVQRTLMEHLPVLGTDLGTDTEGSQRRDRKTKTGRQTHHMLIKGLGDLSGGEPRLAASWASCSASGLLSFLGLPGPSLLGPSSSPARS